MQSKKTESRARKRRPAPSAPVIIGLDFGTSSTKVAFRLQGEEVSWVAPGASTADSLPWFCAPTAVVERDGRVWFGDRADARPNVDGPCLKLALLDSDLPSGQFGEVEKGVIAYLAWILDEAAATIRDHYDLDRFRVVLNIGVPVAYFGDREKLHQRFERYEAVARAALAASTLGGGAGVSQGLPVASLQRTVEAAIERRSQMENVAVMPESIAALVSLERDPLVDPGTYSVIDIGAGTTEVSTSRLEASIDGRSICCYQDSTERRGVLDLDVLDLPPSHSRCMSLLRQWWNQWKANWEKSRRKDAKNRHQHKKWRLTIVVFTGGGGFHPEIRRYLEAQLESEPCRWPIFEHGPPRMVPVAYEPSEQALRPARNGPSRTRNAFHLLAVAHGLSYHRREWPKWYRPEEIEPLPDPEPAPLPEDPRDAGYHGR